MELRAALVPPNAFARAFLLVLVAALAAALLLPAARLLPNALIEDDGFFYAQIAYNLATTGRSSFDGINETSGYHLLWMGVLAAVSWLGSLVSGAKLFHLYLYLWLNLGLCLALAMALGETWTQRLGAFALALLGSFLTEATLLALLIVQLASRFLDEDEPLGSRWSDRLVLFLVPLTRIDATLALLPPLAWLIFQRRNGRWPCALALTGGIATQLLLMLLLFGSVIPVSARIKLAYSPLANLGETLWINLANSPGNAFRALVAFALLGMIAVGLRYVPSTESRWRQAALALGAALYFGTLMALLIMRDWHYLPLHAVLYFVAVRACAASVGASLHQAMRGLGVAIAAVYTGAFVNYQLTYAVDQANSLAFVQRVADHVSEGQPIYQVDASGYTGFFSGRPIVNGDGLVNSAAYAERRLRGELDGYLEESGICYLITNLDRSASDSLVDYHGLRVAKDAATLLLTVPPGGPNPRVRFALYRLDRPGC